MTDTRRFAAAWYAHGYLRELVLIYPSYAIMMGERGISPLELSTLFVVWTGTALLLQIPAGTLADRTSRKRLLIVSGLVKGSAFLVWWQWPTFTGFTCGFVLWGTGSSLVSGTAEAFLYDTLRARGASEAFARIYGRGVAANSLGVASALLTGGWLAESGYTAPLVLSALAPWAAAAVVAFAFDDPPGRTRSGGPFGEPFVATLAAGIATVRNTAPIRWLVAAIAVLTALYGTLEEYVGPYLAEKETFTLGTIGLVYAIAFGARGLGVAFAERLPARSPRALAALYALSALPLAATLAGPPAWIAGAFALYFAMSATSEVLLQAELQHGFEGHARATVTSVAAMGQRLTGIALYFVIGGIADGNTWHTAVGAAALLTFLLATPFVLTAARRAGDAIG